MDSVEDPTTVPCRTWDRCSMLCSEYLGILIRGSVNYSFEVSAGVNKRGPLALRFKNWATLRVDLR